MNSRTAGFTIVELMVVVTLILILATIAIPSLISSRLAANESAAMQTLRSVCTAQAQFMKSGKADEDGDGSGEHGLLGELSGHVGVRGGDTKVPTDLTASMRNVSDDGEISKSGYVYRMYLPDFDGHGVPDRPGGGVDPGVIDPDHAEVVWCCYAWPTRYGVSGRRTFFVNQQGDILFTESRDYSGPGCAVLVPGSAFLTADPESILGRTAVGTTGADGKVWRVAN